MRTFTDAAGRTWSIHMTLGSAMRVKQKLGVDLLRIEEGDPPLLTRLGVDELLLGEVICAMLEPQFQAANVNENDIRNSFDGGTLRAAVRAFHDELIDFFQSSGRNFRAKAVAKQLAMIDAAMGASEAKIDAMDVATTIGGMTSGESRASSASTPEK